MSAQNQDEGKRFVTVVYEVPAVYGDDLSEVPFGSGTVKDIREGNALDTLDNIETNVIAAIRGAKGQS